LSSGLESTLRRLGAGESQPVYLVAGDLVLAEPAAQRLAAALAERAGCAVETHRRPPRLTPVLEDLRTYSLFSPGKVLLVVASALLADRNAAADLLDEAAQGVPVEEGDLSPRARGAASRLLQALRLFGIDPLAGEPQAALAALPGWALEGGRTLRRGKPRGRPKRETEELRADLAQLLAAARAAEVSGYAEGDLAELSAIVAGGLPHGHALVLAEESVAAGHPLVAALSENGAVVEMGRVESNRDGGFEGVGALAAELERQTGTRMSPGARDELARRTLRTAGGRGGEPTASESTARFAAEYKKLADLSGGATIEAALVEGAVEDRGQEDVWKLLDAIAEGRAGEALEKVARSLRSADDLLAARLQFFGLLATFCRQLSAVGGLLAVARVKPGESNYNTFKARIAPALQADLSDGGKSPVAGLHPFRLHRVYLAASRFDAGTLQRLPWRVLETELRLKGESGEADAALSELIVELAGRRAKRATPRAATGRA
jgi:DNA polymerase III delta subunit